ncbi:hypothetical protein [Singulisphaera sp. PoT]|uniref:hypothetical protein n=1 Tax=Singulisphaera sp. PoT TaxID=3411797 RepID=UPI003BF604ED
MSGQFTYEPDPNASLAFQAIPTVVLRYKTGQDGFGNPQGSYELLPNIRCVGVEIQEGPSPAVARFRYAFGDPFGDAQDPKRVEDVYALDAQGQNVVNHDDRLVVMFLLGEGQDQILFDGFVQVPQADLGSTVEMVTFEALATPIREYDFPLRGAIMRDASTPDQPGADIRSGLEPRFNPDGKPNATPDDADSNPKLDSTIGGTEEGKDDDSEDGGFGYIGGEGEPPGELGEDEAAYPVFLGPVWPPTDKDPQTEEPLCKIKGKTIRIWTLEMAARYVIGVGNPRQRYVKYADLAELKDILVAIVPAYEGAFINLQDDSTFKKEDIEVEDYNVRGEPWPVALHRLIDPYGFAMRFDVELDEDGFPVHHLRVYRKDDELLIKSLYLQAPGDALDPNLTNVMGLKLARDGSDIVNQWRVDTDIEEIEASFILAPGWKISPGDKDTIEKYTGTKEATDYRVYVFDECGEGHWSFQSNSWQEGYPGNLDKLLDPDKKPGDKRSYVIRRRPGKPSLITLDKLGKPLQAKLFVSAKYAGEMPGVWDGTGDDWQEIAPSNWNVLPDRLGFRITADNPNDFKGGIPGKGEPVAYPQGGLINVVEWNSNPTADYPYPRFRLTTVIEADAGIDISAKRREVTMTSFTVERRYDARERFHKRTVSKYSSESEQKGASGNDEFKVDDEKESQSFADALRKESEAGTFAGNVELNGLWLGYKVGDKLDKIVGRDIGLNQTLGTAQGESDNLPSIVTIAYQLEPEQKTVLVLADRRGTPPPKKRRPRRNRKR